MIEPERVLRYRQLVARPSMWHHPLPRVLRELGIKGGGRHARIEEGT